MAQEEPRRASLTARMSAPKLGKKKVRHLIEISELQVTGDPGRDCTGIVLKLWRHDKTFQTNEEPVQPPPQPACRWAERVCFAATLYENRGRFSKKIYQVSLLGRFGGTHRRHRVHGMHRGLR